MFSLVGVYWRQKYFILSKVRRIEFVIALFCPLSKKIKKLSGKCLVNQTLYLILQSDLNKTLKHAKL